MFCWKKNAFQPKFSMKPTYSTQSVAVVVQCPCLKWFRKMVSCRGIFQSVFAVPTLKSFRGPRGQNLLVVDFLHFWWWQYYVVCMCKTIFSLFSFQFFVFFMNRYTNHIGSITDSTDFLIWICAHLNGIEMKPMANCLGNCY